MKFDVLFFGATADAVGSRELEVSVEKATTAKSLIEQLSQQHPALTNQRLLFAINEQYADPDTTLSEGDELAVFTAVSGG